MGNAMNISEFKVDLAQRLLAIDDMALLQKISELMASPSDWWDDLTDDEKREVEEAEEDIVAGRFSTQAQVMERMRAWINK